MHTVQHLCAVVKVGRNAAELSSRAPRNCLRPSGRDRPKFVFGFGYGAETGDIFSFGYGCNREAWFRPTFGYGRNYDRVSA